MYLENPHLRLVHGKAGRARVLQEFRQEVIWEAMYTEYSELLKNKGLQLPNP